jgi:hypothetical protein
MSKISISYRRRDSDAITGRIFDRLVAHYGSEAVFRDIDNIPPGVDFRRYIGDALNSTDVLLAIVGPQWLGKAEGRSRIAEATDLVRIEIEAALKKDIPVVPVLVGNAVMPDASELPDGLKDFVFRNAVKVDALEDFEDHIKRLIRSLDRLLAALPRPAPGAAPVPPPQAPDRDARTKQVPVPDDPPRPRAPEQAAPTPPPPKPEPKPRIDASAPGPSEEPRFAGGQAAARISPLLGMPVLVIVLYGLVYATGAWNLGQAQGFTPAPLLAQAVLFVICFAWYGRAGLGPSLLGGAVLLAAASGLALANSYITAAIFTGMAASARAGPAVLIGFVNSVVFVAVLMAIGARLCPILRQSHYWIIALIAYPILSLVVGSALPFLAAQNSPDRDTVLAVIFASYVVKQLAIFTCLGAWVARPAPDVAGVFS